MAFFASCDGLDDNNHYALATGGTRGTAGAGNLTVRAWIWVETTATSAVRYYLMTDDGSNWGWSFHTEGTNATIYFRLRGPANVFTDVTATLSAAQHDRWLEVGGVAGNGNLYLYLDGVLINTVSFPNNYVVPGSAINLGRRPNAVGFSVNGTIRIAGYASGNYIATAAQVSLAYAQGLLTNHDIDAIDGFDEHLYSFAIDGDASDILHDQIGTDHMTRIGTPTFTAGDAYVVPGTEGYMTPFGLCIDIANPQKFPKWKAAGVNWVRVDVPWYQIEQSQGGFTNWPLFDTMVAQAQAQGLAVLGIIGYTAEWASSDAGNTDRDARRHAAPLEIYDANWSNYVAMVTTRYKGSILKWEMYNEPDNPFLLAKPGCWANNHFPSNNNVDQKRFQYKHQIDLALAVPSLDHNQITTGGYSEAGYSGGDLTFHAYLDSLTGWLDQFPIANYHCYGGYNDTTSRLVTINQKWQTSKANHGTNNALNEFWVTEHGITENMSTYTDATMKTYVIRSYALALSLPFVTKVFWFAAQYTTDAIDMENSTGGNTSVYLGYQILTNRLVKPKKFSSYKSGTTRGVLALLADGSQTAILWNDSASPTLTSLGLGATHAYNQDGNEVALSQTLSAQPIFATIPGTGVIDTMTIEITLATRVLNVLQRGVIRGTLADNTARSTNTANFNAAIKECTTNGMILYVPPGVYEIYGQLTITDNYFRWFGTMASEIKQFNLSSACIHVGGVLGTGSNGLIDCVIDGARLRYSGTGLVGANALELNGAFMCNFKNMEIGDFTDAATAVSIPRIGIYMDQLAGTVPCFSNIFENIRIDNYSYMGISMFRDDYSAATQNIFKNIYLIGGNGSGQRQLASGGMPLYVGASLGQCFYGLNIEWTKFTVAMHLEATNGMTIQGFNLEGCSLVLPAAGYTGFIELYAADLSMKSMALNDCRLLTANNITSASVFSVGPQSTLSTDQIFPELMTKDTGIIFSGIQNFGTNGDFSNRIDLGHWTLGNSDKLDRLDNFVFATGKQGALFGALADFNNNSPVEGGNANATFYPYGGPGIIRGLLSGGNKTYTMARTCTATITCIIPRSVHRRFFCETASASSMVVANYNGTTIMTLAPGTGGSIAFNGTDWVQV